MAWLTLSRAYIWKTCRWLDEAWLYFLYSFSECGNNQYFALEAAIPDHGPDVPFRSTYLPDLVTYSSFYNVGFSQSKISVKKCFWQKSNQYLRCLWRWHGTFTLSVTHLKVSWYLWSYVCNAKGKIEGHWRALCLLKKSPSIVRDRAAAGRSEKEKCPPWFLSTRQNDDFSTKCKQENSGQTCCLRPRHGVMFAFLLPNFDVEGGGLAWGSLVLLRDESTMCVIHCSMLDYVKHFSL